jgi:predicted nucleic acid-binding protein
LEGQYCFTRRIAQQSMEKELILCDTNIFISWFTGDDKTITSLQAIGLENILIPSVTTMELIQGIRNKQELVQFRKKLKNYNIIHFNEKTSQIAVELMVAFKLSMGLLIPDAIIAATALAYNLQLFTYNLKDFNFIPNLRLYRP